MCQLMRQEALTIRRTGCIATSIEHHMRTDHLGPRIHIARGLLSLGIGMHTDMAEIPLKARLKECASSRGQRLSR